MELDLLKEEVGNGGMCSYFCGFMWMKIKRIMNKPIIKIVSRSTTKIGKEESKQPAGRRRQKIFGIIKSH